MCVCVSDGSWLSSFLVNSVVCFGVSCPLWYPFRHVAVATLKAPIPASQSINQSINQSIYLSIYLRSGQTYKMVATRPACCRSLSGPSGPKCAGSVFRGVSGALRAPGPRVSKKCPKSVPRLFQKVSRTLLGHSGDTLGTPGGTLPGHFGPEGPERLLWQAGRVAIKWAFLRGSPSNFLCLSLASGAPLAVPLCTCPN